LGDGGAAADDAHGAIVTESGPLKGTTVNGVREYLGIPYAAPPLGSLRWMPPQSFGKWKGLLQATHFGSECPQAPSPFGTASNDEDCLFLNVYTPQGEENESKSHRRSPADKQRSDRPVMVWIHGGALLVGGGDLYDPTPLVKQGGVIVVTINYRPGLLGFLLTQRSTKKAIWRVITG
jgi:para-nitrobenzyl esterase